MINIDYQPSLSLSLAKKRAQMLYKIRQFFTLKDVLEVSTPILSKAGNTDVYIESVQANFHHLGKPITGYLHTSPEFAMKRLLASYRTAIYQICPVFRDNEKGRRHNIEFTMLEWYRPGFDLQMLADELQELLTVVLERPVQLERCSYSQAFLTHLGIHPLSAPISDLRQLAIDHQLTLDMGQDRQGWLDLLFSHLIEPKLGYDNPVIIFDYPPATAALAKTVIDADGHLVAKRFELYIKGLEIANAYDESSNSKELKSRFEADNQARHRLGLPQMPVDDRLLAACDHLPDCSGIALGVDRLFMIKEDLSSIDQAIAITTDKA